MVPTGSVAEDQESLATWLQLDTGAVGDRTETATVAVACPECSIIQETKAYLGESDYIPTGECSAYGCGAKLRNGEIFRPAKE